MTKEERNTPPIPIMKEDGEAMTEDEKREAIRKQVNKEIEHHQKTMDDLFIESLSYNREERGSVEICHNRMERIIRWYDELSGFPIFYGDTEDDGVHSFAFQKAAEEVLKCGLFSKSENFRIKAINEFSALEKAIERVEDIFCVALRYNGIVKDFPVDETNS